MQLAYLNLSDNQLIALHDNIGAMKGLLELGLYHKQVASLPNSICALTHLRELHAQHNQLSGLPANIGALANLRELVLAVHCRHRDGEKARFTFVWAE